jgi:hypothetical protein
VGTLLTLQSDGEIPKERQQPLPKPRTGVRPGQPAMSSINGRRPLPHTGENNPGENSHQHSNFPAIRSYRLGETWGDSRHPLHRYYHRWNAREIGAGLEMPERADHGSSLFGKARTRVGDRSYRSRHVPARQERPQRGTPAIIVSRLSGSRK